MTGVAMGDSELKKLYQQQLELNARLLARLEAIESRMAAPVVATPAKAETSAAASMTVAEILEDYTATVPGKATNPVTLSQIKKLCETEIRLSKKESKRFGSFTWSELSRGICDLYRIARTQQKSLKGGQIKDATVDRELSTLQAALSMLVAANKATHDPIANFKRMPGNRRKSAPTREEWDALLAHVPPIARDIGILAHLTGTRPGEIEGLLKEELNYQLHEIDLTKRPGAKTGARPIVVVKEGWEIIERRAKESRGPFVFVAPKDPSATKRVGVHNIGRWLREAAKVSGIRGKGNERLVMYSARHGKITEMLRNGVSIWEVAEQTGTSAKMIKKHYGHFDELERKALREKLEGKDMPKLRVGPRAVPAPKDSDGTDGE